VSSECGLSMSSAAQGHARNVPTISVLLITDATDATDARDSHSDVHSAYGDTPMSTDIAGHEGVGHVVKRTSLPGH
jgi:hypothetical protein